MTRVPAAGDSALYSTEQGVVGDLKSHNYSGANQEINEYRQSNGNGQLWESDRSNLNTYLQQNGFPKLEVVDAKSGSGTQSFIVSSDGAQSADKIAGEIHTDGNGNMVGAAAADKDLAALYRKDSGHSGLADADVAYINAVLASDNLPQITKQDGVYKIDAQPATVNGPDIPSPSTTPPGDVAVPGSNSATGTAGVSDTAAGAPAGTTGTTGSGDTTSAPTGSATPTDTATPTGTPPTPNFATAAATAQAIAGQSEGSNTSAAGQASIKYAMQYLESQGLNANAAAGVVGNLMQEDPGLVAGQGQIGGGGGEGIAQWTSQGLKNDLQTYIKAHGGVDNLSTELGFLSAEIHGKIPGEANYGALLGELNSAGGGSNAATIFMNGFENPLASAANLTGRQSNAGTALSDA